MIERFVDYAQASLCLSESAVILKGFRAISPVRFYKRGYQHPMGFRLYFGNPKSKDALIVASGETMRSLRNDYLDAEILDWILSKGGKVSRLDLAITEWNTFEGMVELGDVEKWYSRGLIESPLVAGGLKEISSILPNSGRIAETLYIGEMSKRGKKGIFRAYDKGIELGIGEYMATRLELELKRDNAQSTAMRIAESNDIAGNFRSKFNVRAKDFERLMDADTVSTKRGKALVKGGDGEETNKRWEWLLNQVAPALKEAIAEERKAGREDVRLVDFMGRAGLLEDARKIARYLSESKYRDMLERNELVPRKAEKD